jgi:hypothetical protein
VHELLNDFLWGETGYKANILDPAAIIRTHIYQPRTLCRSNYLHNFVFVGSLSNCIDPASAFFDLSPDVFIATAVIYFSGRVTYAIVARGTKK